MSTPPDPRHILRRCDDAYDLLGLVYRAYKAAHEDAYDLAGTGTFEAVNSSDVSDPVGDRWDDHGMRDLDDRNLRNAANVIESVNVALTRALNSYLRAHSEQRHSRNTPDLSPARRSIGDQVEPDHLLLGAGACPHDPTGTGRCRPCAQAELAHAKAMQAKRNEGDAA